MRIENLRLEALNGRHRAVATIIWEDIGRSPYDLYFETETEFSEDLSCDPHAFLIGSAIPAMHYGERRVFIDAEICPELHNGLRTALAWLGHWFYGGKQCSLGIEAKKRSSLSSPRTPERAGFFFSGGIDSFGTLISNHQTFPARHPWYIKDGFLIFGLEQDDAERFKYVRAALSNISRENDITLLPVYTNVYLPYREEDRSNHFAFWDHEFQAAALSSVAHAFSRRVTVVSIPASDAIPTDVFLKRKQINPSGTHPVLDYNYSSCEVRIRHDGVTLSRFEKTQLVADQHHLLTHLRVCNQYKRYQSNRLNCGMCEKCFRTMLTLRVIGVLDRTDAFPRVDLYETLKRQKNLNPYFYLELLGPLEKIGLHKMVKEIKKKISLYRRQKRADKVKEKIKEYLKYRHPK